MSDGLPSGSNRNKVEYLAEQVDDLRTQITKQPAEVDTKGMKDCKVFSVDVPPVWDDSEENEQEQTVHIIWDWNAANYNNDFLDNSDVILQIRFIQSEHKIVGPDLSKVKLQFDNDQGHYADPVVMVRDNKGNISFQKISDICGNANYSSRQNSTMLRLAMVDGVWCWLGGYITATKINSDN